MIENLNMEKKYLGDAVYYQYDGYHVVLTTEYGGGLTTNQIFLDPQVLQALLATLAKEPALKDQIEIGLQRALQLVKEYHDGES